MSASLVRKALDETRLTADEKLELLSKGSKKKFKPLKKKKVIPKDILLKQNLKVLKALDYKVPRKKNSPSISFKPPPAPVKEESKSKKKKSKKGKKTQQKGDSCFTEEDFEKFEKEYFVTS
ncbi:hypothetical protein Ocin01_13636 [Orchesella cincta]|uniref:Active regulator of SIRT1 n=1 Tax=Orchesella cincta TaxID=48709 RepID=A0A1D2MJ99_ORCCI|nr:hypothetical protein Ocin01_13636 [Orchesella cincta]